MIVFEGGEIPVLTANEVADSLDWARPTAYNEREALVEQGDLLRKTVGARAAVAVLTDPFKTTS